MPLPVNGDLLADRYELAEVIGVGGMAVVHRAWDTRLRRPVAVKLFAATTDLDDARRFDVEAIVSRLHRSPVVPEHLPADLVRLLSLMTARSPGDRPAARHCAEVLRADRLTAVSAVPPSAPRRRALVASAAGLLGAMASAGSSSPARPHPCPTPSTPPSPPPSSRPRRSLRHRR